MQDLAHFPCSQIPKGYESATLQGLDDLLSSRSGTPSVPNLMENSYKLPAFYGWGFLLLVGLIKNTTIPPLVNAIDKDTA